MSIDTKIVEDALDNLSNAVILTFSSTDRNHEYALGDGSVGEVLSWTIEDTEEMKKDKFEVGKSYRTYGGWEAKVIWRSVYKDGTLLAKIKQSTLEELSQTGYIPYKKKQDVTYWAVHQPYTHREVLVKHSEDGKCYSSLAVSEPPIFDVPHPAWLTETEIL